VKLAYVPSCKRPDFKLTLHPINVFCVVTVVKKCIMVSAGSLLVFCTAKKQDTVPLVLTTTNCTYTFAQPAVHTARWN